MFDGWYRLREACSRCKLVYEPHDGDTYAFMYLSAAFFTGLLIVGMLLAWSRPSSTVGAAIMLAAAVVIFMVGTLPTRKGIAIALDYVVSCRCGASSDTTRPVNPSHKRDS